VKEILLAALGVLGVAIPSVIQLMTGESRRVSNMRATLDLMQALPADDEKLQAVRDQLRASLAHEARLDKDESSHRQFFFFGSAVFLVCLACSYFVMQPPGSGHTRSELHSVFILLTLVFYVVGAVAVVHAAHLFARNQHLFHKHVPPVS
jgi:hypothetical protein